MSTARYQPLIEAKDWSALRTLCLRRLRTKPRDHEAHHHLCFALIKLELRQEAIAQYQQALRLWPDDAEFLVNCANQLLQIDRNDEALPLLEKACKLCPDSVYPWLLLSQLRVRLCQHEVGYEAANNAYKLARQHTEMAAALCQRAIHRRELGQVREAVLDTEAALALEPSNLGAHVNRMLFMLADPGRKIADIVNAAKQFSEIAEAPYRQHWPAFEHLRAAPWKKLRIGFLSGDFRNHPVMYFIEGLLAQLDRRQFEVYAFYLHPAEDALTDRTRAYVDHFVKVEITDPEQQCQLIREHNIDIAIDLAGHTGHTSILALARKAAPIQVSWLGFPATTGLQAMDYKFTDHITDPEGAESQYSEKLFRLPTLFCCYRPLVRQPLWRYQPAYAVQPPPMLRNGYITFGSCNNLGKLTDEVLTLWGKVLQAVPHSRLLIEGKSLNVDSVAARYRQRCAALGIDTDRLDLEGIDTANQYLTYHRIDIALDPFPLTGGTTTFDLLWMGVPLVSMVGDSFKSRLSTGILTHLQRTKWLAHNEQEYLNIACELAADATQLRADRLAQRTRLEQSVLMHEDVFNHHYGMGLRSMWMAWLAQQQFPGDETRQCAQIEAWKSSMPEDLAGAAPKEVALTMGSRTPLTDAHAYIEHLLSTAHKQAPHPHQNTASIQHDAWRVVTETATRILCCVPHDPVALAVLAEVEHAHGHTDFAVTYLRYAQEALMA